MEVISYPKRLRRHAAPLVLLALVFSLVSAVTFGRYSTLATGSDKELSQALVTQFAHVTPTRDGLARVTFNTSVGAPAATSAAAALPVQHYGSRDQLGTVARTTLIFDSIKPAQQ